jgi:NADH-quinone oxidoreductase subunit N
MFIFQLSLIYIEIIFFFLIINLLIFCLFLNYCFETNLKQIKLNYIISKLLSLILFILLFYINIFKNIYLYSNFLECEFIDYNFNFYIFNYVLNINNFALLFKYLIILITFFLISLAKDYFRYELELNFEYILLFLISILSIFIIVSSNNLLILYLVIEIQALSFYILSAIKINSHFSLEAGLKYFTLSSLSSGLLLLGFSFLYGFTGIINFNDFLLYFSNDIFSNFFFLFLLSMILIIISLFFKLGIFPFNNWLPDVYEGSPTLVTFWFAILSKISVILIFIKFFYYIFYNLNNYYFLIFLIFLIINLFIGSILALYQIKIKRLIAYSSIVQASYLLIGLLNPYFYSLIFLIFFLLIYFINIINIFSILINLRYKFNNNKFKNFYQISGLIQTNSLIAMSLGFSFFSMAGIPPLAGFFSKFFILKSFLIYSFLNNFLNILIILIIILISLISAVYYIRFSKIIFLDMNYLNKYIFLNNLSFTSSYLIFITFILNFLIIFFPNLIYYFCYLISFYFFY